MKRHEQMSAVYADLKEVLTTAQQKRSENDDPEVWIPYERQQMTDQVKLVRSQRGEPEMDPEVLAGKILRAENLATGHVDYVAKYAWGCVQIIVGLED